MSDDLTEVYSITPNLRWIVRDWVMILQQAWVGQFTGAIDWRDVPRR